MNVEQAIFTSAKTDRSVGYQVIGHSPGIHQIDARELAVWCPSHDSLLDQGPEAESFNFHPLPSGAYCVSRTVPAGWEYSGRGGLRVYTHCLIVSPEVLAHFANNPFAVLQSAMSAGAMEICDPIPARMEPLLLSGGASPVDQALLGSLGEKPGPSAMAVLIQAALDAACLAVAGEPSPRELFAGLFSCLPPACRLEFSFSTGLKYSGRRPFHLIALPGDPSERRWIAHQNNVTVLDLAASKPLPSIPIDGWARFIERVLASGQTAFFATQISKRRFDLGPDDLPAFGLQLLEDLDTATFSNLGDTGGRTKNMAEKPDFYTSGWSNNPSGGNSSDGSGSKDSAGNEKQIQQAHAAHRRFEKTQIESQKQAAHVAVDAPSARLNPESPETLEKLELLDDLVYDAISGRSGALEQLQAVWPALKNEVDCQMLAESREQYLRFALTIWESCVDNNFIRNPAKAVQALDVLCLLFEE
jgi:GTPase-associated protein 1, N-terminal domain type 2